MTTRTTDLDDYDETWCGFFCQHPECWKSYSRSSKGKPRKPDKPLNQSPRSLSTGLPTMKICSLQAFGEEDSSDEFEDHSELDRHGRDSADSLMSPLHESFHPTRKIIIVNQDPPIDIRKKERACSLPIIPGFLESSGSPPKESESKGSPQQDDKGYVSVVSMEDEFRPWEEAKLNQSSSSRYFYRWIPNPQRRRYQQSQEHRSMSLPFPRDVTTELLTDEINESERFIPRQKALKSPRAWNRSAAVNRAMSMHSSDTRYKSSVPQYFDRDTLFEEPMEEYAKKEVVVAEKHPPLAQMRKSETKKKDTLKTQVKITKLSPWSDGSSDKNHEIEDEHFMSTKEILQQLQLQPKKTLSVSIRTPVAEDQLKESDNTTTVAPTTTTTTTTTTNLRFPTYEIESKPKIPASYSLHMLAQRAKPKQTTRKKNAKFKSVDYDVDETPYQTTAPSPDVVNYDTAPYRQRNGANKMQTQPTLQSSPFTWAPPPSPASKAHSRRVAIIGVKYRGHAVDMFDLPPTRPISNDHMRVLHHIDAGTSLMTLTVMPPMDVSSQPTTLTVQLPQDPPPPPPRVPDVPLTPNSILRTLASQPTAYLDTSLIPSTPPLTISDSLLRIDGRSLEELSANK